MSKSIIIQNNLYKYHFSINLADDLHIVTAKKGFRNPVKAFAYVTELQKEGHIVWNEEAYVELKKHAELFTEN